MKTPLWIPALILLQAAVTLAATTPVLVSPPELKLTGDWTVEISLTTDSGPLQSIVAVQPPQPVVVTNERLDRLEDWTEQAGWARKKIPGLVDGMCSARFVLDEASLTVRSAPDAGATVFEAGKDYRVDREWGGIGRVAAGSIGSGQPVFLSYRFHQRRLDSIVMTQSGGIVLRQGAPHIAIPKPPELTEGEVRLANLWLPENIQSLQPENLFPILETAYPEPPRANPTEAERLLPKTVAKLRSGEPVKILAWGDSVTAGYLGEDQWQAQFVRRLQQAFPQARIELITVGWGAHTSRDFLTAPSGHTRNFAESVLAHRPDLVVSEFVNDCELDLALTERNYRKFLTDFQQIGAEWLILTPHYSTFMNAPSERDLDVDPRPYVHMVRRFAQENRIALADAADRYGRLWRQGIPYSTLMVNTANHPDVRGMKIFADSLMALFPSGEGQ